MHVFAKLSYWDLFWTGLVTLFYHFVVSSGKPMDTDVTLDECYEVDDRRECFSYPLNWHTSYKWAQQFCTNRASTLVVINNQQKQDAVEKFVSVAKFHDNVLIGATLYSSAEWIWANKIPFENSYGPIANLSLNSSDFRVKGTVSVSGNKVTFVARHPADNLPYVCQYKVGAKYCTGTTQHFERDQLCYVAYTDHYKGWHYARNHCLRNKGELAVFNDMNDIDRTALTSVVPYWVGLHNSWWTLSNGREMLYSNWAPGQPSDGDKCVALSAEKQWQWKTLNCADKLPVFICQLIVDEPAGHYMKYFWFLLVTLAVVVVFSKRKSLLRSLTLSSFATTIRRQLRPTVRA